MVDRITQTASLSVGARQASSWAKTGHASTSPADHIGADPAVQLFFTPAVVKNHQVRNITGNQYCDYTAVAPAQRGNLG